MTRSDAAEMAGARVERLLGQLRSSTDPAAAAVAEDLVRCLVQLYGDGLHRIVGMVGAEQAAGLCADPLVESLLLVHDLHPLDTGTRVARALEEARPRTGGAVFAGLDEAGVVHVRMPAGGKGCGSTRQAAREAVETAVRRAAPEATGVEVEVPPAPAPLLQVSLRPGLQGSTARS
jgi:Fe-S cluster biogenesis protein NfuA